MSSHAETQLKRLITCAANATDPRRKKMFQRLVKRWTAYAAETFDQRAARIKNETIAWEARQAAKGANLADRNAASAVRAEQWAARQAKRYAHETLEQRAEREAAAAQRWQERKKIKRGRVKQKHFERSDAARLIAERKRPAVPELPPLPYGTLPPLPY